MNVLNSRNAIKIKKILINKNIPGFGTVIDTSLKKVGRKYRIIIYGYTKYGDMTWSYLDNHEIPKPIFQKLSALY